MDAYREMDFEKLAAECLHRRLPALTEAISGNLSDRDSIRQFCLQMLAEVERLEAAGERKVVGAEFAGDCKSGACEYIRPGKGEHGL